MKLIRANEAPAPANRPKCPNCNRPLRPWWTVKSERIEREGGGFVYRDTLAWNGGYHGYGAFDRLSCAEEFANLAHKAGYRRKF